MKKTKHKWTKSVEQEQKRLKENSIRAKMKTNEKLKQRKQVKEQEQKNKQKI